MKIRRFLVVVMLLFVSAAPVWADDQTTSVDSIRERAAQGEAAAQTILGAMYHDGQGVPQNYAEAFKWYRRAAAQGDAAAQFNVGFLYSQGNGGPQDDVEAYKWFTLAAATYTEKQFRDGAVQARDRVAARLTPALIAEAQKRVCDWKKQ